jgi:hypothetical protein
MAPIQLLWASSKIITIACERSTDGSTHGHADANAQR